VPELRGDETISAALEASCAQEPIHIIGTVQAHGFVLVVDVYTTRILQTSSGVARHWIGLVDGARLLDCPLARWVDGLEPDVAQSLMSLPTAGLQLLPFLPRRDQLSLPFPAPAPDPMFECVGHRVGDVAILEWQPLGERPPAGSEDVGRMQDLRGVIARLRIPKRIEVFYRDCVREVARISGFDRVMLYRFLPDWSGEVIAERAAKDLRTRFLGLRFPASDIPTQARALFVSSKIRVLADALAVPDVLVPPLLPGGLALDQTYSLLRGISEVHRTYLGNMGVRATMSLSIMSEDKLWGLIACHHYQPRTLSLLVIDALRQVCELIAEIVALRIESLSQVESRHDLLLIEHLLNRIEQGLLLDEDARSILDRSLPQLLLALGADGFYASVGGLHYAGESGGPVIPRGALLDEVAGLFDTASHSSVLQRVDLRIDGGTPLVSLPAAAGLLATYRVAEQLEFCAFTRPEVATEVRWAGAPSKLVATSADGRIVLQPRRSFEVWKESVAGRARDWTRTEADACERLLRMLSDSGKRKTHSQLQQLLVWHAHHDHLTGLHNRRTLEETLARYLSEQREDIALMLIDLDNFKLINDSKGHAIGDQLLQELSRRMTAAIGPRDTLARVGGDEFSLIAQMTDAGTADALRMAARLHEAVVLPFDLDGHPTRLGISIGIAVPPMDGTNSKDLMRRADVALYSAKKLGRSQSVLFDPSLELALVRPEELARDLHDAIGKGQLWVAFQPEISLGTGRVVGLEALARWEHPTRGAIGPNEFIPIAEHNGLINEIGQWVVRTVIATQAGWREDGMRSLPVAVNVSMTEITSGRLVDHIGATLAEFRAPPHCLGIELTESVIMSDPGLALGVLESLRKLGVTAALDDFGTGYSSLSYLRQLPLNCLKVDRSFTAALTDDEHTRSLTEAIIRMAESLKMTTIAEGVETPAQLQWLVEHGCDMGQGFLFSHPLPAVAVYGAVDRIEAAWSLTH